MAVAIAPGEPVGGHFGKQDVQHDGAAPADHSPDSSLAKARGLRDDRAPGRHRRQAQQRNRLVAEAGAEPAGRNREQDARQHEQPDQGAGPGVGEPEIDNQRRHDCRDRLETDRDADPRREQHREDRPSIHAKEMPRIQNWQLSKRNQVEGPRPERQLGNSSLRGGRARLTACARIGRKGRHFPAAPGCATDVSGTRADR